MSKHDYETKAKIVRKGGSEVFANWHKCGLVTEDEFLEALEWLCDDPGDAPGRRMTREIGLEVTPDMEMKLFMEGPATEMEKAAFGGSWDESKLMGRIVRLRRVYTDLGDFCGFYGEDGSRWTGHVSLSVRDRI